MRRPDRVYGPKILKQMAQSCIYAWRRRRQWLYVGRSVLGLARVLSRHHVKIVERCRKGDRLLTWHCANEAELARLEVSLIRRYRPKYNVTDKPRTPKPMSKKEARQMYERMLRHCAYPKCSVRFIPQTMLHRYHSAVCRNAHWQDQHPRQYMAFRYVNAYDE